MTAARGRCPNAFPRRRFYFQAADIVTQILNFGLPAPIDVQRRSLLPANNREIARELQERVAASGIRRRARAPGSELPAFFASIDRFARAAIRASASSNRVEPQRCAVLLVPGFAQFLDRSRHRHPLFLRRPDAGTQPRHDQRPAQYSRLDLAGRRQWRADSGLLSNVATLKRDASRPTPTSPISSRSMKSSPACRASTSARPPASRPRDRRPVASSSSRAIASKWSGRSNRCAMPSAISASVCFSRRCWSIF